MRVIDGDTLDLPDGERVRVLNIDTPKMPPRSQCENERRLALEAKARLQALVREGELVFCSGPETVTDMADSCAGLRSMAATWESS